MSSFGRHRVLAALGDTRGAAAVEFALILPILFVLHIAAAEFLQVYQAQRKLAHLAAAVADITAQNRSVSIADVDDILAAGTSMIHPFNTASLGQRVSSVSTNGSGSANTDWTQKKNYTLTGSPSVPAGYLAANESVIMVEVVYDYSPTFGLFLPDVIRFTRQAYVRPRLSPKVERTT